MLKIIVTALFAACFFVITSCRKDEVLTPPQNGLVADIPFDENAFDKVNNITATNHRAVLFPDRHGIENHAMYFNSDDSAYLDFSDAASYSFPQNIFTI